MKKKSVLMVFFFYSFFVMGQESQENNSTQANNPLANMTALSFHNYYIPKLTDTSSDAYLNTSWVRFAKPLANGKLLFRFSVPLSTIAFATNTGSINSENGLGDINAFLSYSFVSTSTTTLGIGPSITAPTASDDILGTGKWQGGLTFVAFLANSSQFQWGGLVTWQTSFAGDHDRSSTNNAAIQPFYFWQLGKGTYLRGAPIWFFDFKNDNYHVPFALGIGKVVQIGKTTCNLFIEPQYSMLHNGIQPQFQLFTGINLQFSK
ncbi:hypothetical protein [Aquimarina sediminis]|uniref:hypothetical protein n=1 Tax=Aquimarina sediminis TaxID=2070536 RepID=UPI0019D457E0|nr:hypothetical protein [Aquimarina sediminis]